MNEGLLQYRMRQQLHTVFGDGVVIVDWDTRNTSAGRPDVVLLNQQKQLIVVEIEPELTRSNIEHALIAQAWQGAKDWYSKANQSDISEWYRYTFRYLHRQNENVPDIRQELGFAGNDPVLWDRRKTVVIVAAAPSVEAGVDEVATKVVESQLRSDPSNVPHEFWIYQITGNMTSSDIDITGRERWGPIDKSSELEVAPPEGHGPPTPRQHLRRSLTFEYEEVRKLLPKHTSAELEEAGYDLQLVDRLDVLKLKPWYEYDADICFEFSRVNHKDNPIKGPHCQLRIGKMGSLGSSVQQLLACQLPTIAATLGCPLDDLACRQRGWPLKQHRVWKPNQTTHMSPDDIARALGRFCSVVYPIVNPMIRSTLSRR